MEINGLMEKYQRPNAIHTTNQLILQYKFKWPKKHQVEMGIIITFARGFFALGLTVVNVVSNLHIIYPFMTFLL